MCNVLKDYTNVIKKEKNNIYLNEASAYWLVTTGYANMLAKEIIILLKPSVSTNGEHPYPK